MFKKMMYAMVISLTAVIWPTFAQNIYPNQPIKFIVPYSPGGLPDTVARQLSISLGQRLGQSIVVDNRPGGGGVIAAQTVKSAPADGYTFLVTDTISFNMSPITNTNLPYNPKKDFTPIALVARAPNFLAILPNIPANNIDEFATYVKAHPGQINYGSSGIGTPHHLAMEALKSALNLDMTHVPFKGTSQSVPALVGGQVQAVYAALPSLSGFVKTNQVKIIGVASLQPSKLAPTVPAIGQKIPGYEYVHVIGIFGLSNIPADVIKKINTELEALANIPTTQETLSPMGIEFNVVGPVAAQKHLVDETARLEKLIKDTKLQLQ
jgi:tripartite-type tricarboxylate transporter receptor subunit TctC